MIDTNGTVQSSAYGLERPLDGRLICLGGQRVTPQAALESGFQFIYPTIDEALGAIVGREPAAGNLRSTATRSPGVGFPAHDP